MLANWTLKRYIIGKVLNKKSLIKNFNIDDLINDGYIEISRNFKKEVEVFNKFLGRICNGIMERYMAIKNDFYNSRSKNFNYLINNLQLAKV